VFLDHSSSRSGPLSSGGPTPQIPIPRWKDLLDESIWLLFLLHGLHQTIRSLGLRYPRLHTPTGSQKTERTPRFIQQSPVLEHLVDGPLSHLYARKSGATERKRDSGSRSQPCVKTRLSRGLVLWLHTPTTPHALWHRVPSPRRIVRTRVLFLKAISPYTTPPYSHAQIFRAVHRRQG
jgi:hypothetical protein